MDRSKRPWYISTWFIALLCCFYMLYVPVIVAIILIIMQSKHDKKIAAEYKTIDDVNNYKETTENLCQEKLQSTEMRCQEMLQATKTHCQEKLQSTETSCQKKLQSTETSCQKKLQSVNAECKMQENIVSVLKYEKLELQQEISRLESDLVSVTVTMPFVDDAITSEEYKSKYSMTVLKEKEMVKDGRAVLIKDRTKSKRDNNNAVKLILRCFNAETDTYISNITVKNIDSVKNKIIKAFETLNKICELIEVIISQDYLSVKLAEADCMYSFQYQKEQERLQQKAIREQMVEEEKVRREIEKEKAKIEKEETQFKNEIDNLIKRLRAASEIEQQIYADKIRELEEKLKSVEESKKDVLNRERSTRAGFVYIISNVGSFGDNIYKIGMTRRLDPMDRINELSSASVPFEFDVHAMIFSEDAPALETMLHNRFDDKRVNMVNKRKEFFRVSLEEIENVVKSEFNATVTFTRVALAEQFRETQKMLNQKYSASSAVETRQEAVVKKSTTVKSVSETIQKIAQSSIPDYRCQEEDTADFYKLHIYTTGNQKVGVIKIVKSDLSMQFRKLGSNLPVVHKLQSPEELRNLV